MTRRTGRDGDGGFTLVEVLVAFFIAALTLAVALRVLGEGAGWARVGPEAALRMEETASILDTLLADPGLAPGERSGTYRDGRPWRVQIVDVTAGVTPGGPGRLLRVAFANGDGAASLVTLATVPAARR